MIRLSAITPSGHVQLGNYLGAIRRWAAEGTEQDVYFISDLHAMTTSHNPSKLRALTREQLALLIAAGVDPHSVSVQSDLVRELGALTWILECTCTYGEAARMIQFKEKSAGRDSVRLSLLTYPVLMAADILLYDAHVVPVGKDQKQHIEITRDIASAFNRSYGEDTFVVPEARIDQQLMTVPGTDGQKMSKSYGNTINVFLPEKELKKQVMSIVTDSKALEEPKDPETDNVFRLFRLVAPAEAVETMRQNYLRGGYGYGHAKKELLDVLLARFAQERANFQALMDDKAELDRQLAVGAEKARTVAQATLKRVRERSGYVSKH
jgi:tryptophanyl-tRNA synthetase